MNNAIRGALLGTLVAGCSVDANADVTVAKTPHSIRQTYPDGTFTEVACHVDKIRLESQACRFVKGSPADTTVYDFSIDKLGYHNEVEVYAYFPMESGLFQVKFAVPCAAVDLALHSDANEMNSTCYLTMGPEKRALVPLFLELDGESGGKHFFETRTFGKVKAVRSADR